MREEIEKLSKAGFTQKEAVEILLTKGFEKEEIKSNIFDFYEKIDTKKYSSSFILSAIGQILLMAFFVTGWVVEEKAIWLMVVVFLFALTFGFFNSNKICTLAWLGIFIISLVTFLILSLTKSQGLLFTFSLLSSWFARNTYSVHEDSKLRDEQYNFD